MPFLLFLILLLPALTLAENSSPFPWPPGEKLTYLIEWGPIDAAEATFTAQAETKQEGIERFELFLRSRGPIEAFFPIRTRITSLTQIHPWRTTEYIQDRNEGGNIRNRRTLPDYSVRLGRFFPAPGKPEENFDLLEGAYEDFGSMLYHVRTYPWKPGASVTWQVIENKEPLFAKISCPQIDTIEIEDHPPRRLIEIFGEPHGSSARYKGWMKIWMTDDARRLPLLAKLKFQYGTFTIRLIRGGGPELDYRPDGEPVPILSELESTPNR
jgi:hypothetical protein